MPVHQETRVVTCPSNALASDTNAAPERVVPASAAEGGEQRSEDGALLDAHDRPTLLQKRADLIVHVPGAPRLVVDVAVVHTDGRGHAARDVQRQEQLKLSMYGARAGMMAQDGSKMLPFILHSRGGMGPSALTFLQELAMAMHQKSMSEPSHMRMQKESAMQCLFRLSGELGRALVHAQWRIAVAAGQLEL